MWAILLRLVGFGGGGLMAELRGALSDWKAAQTDQQRIAAKERVDTLQQMVALSQQQAGVITTAMQSPVFWFVWALFAVPLGLWWAAVVLDSLFLFSGRIADLPPSVKPYADRIFDNVFWTGGGVAGAAVLGKAVTSVIRK